MKAKRAARVKKRSAPTKMEPLPYGAYSVIECADRIEYYCDAEAFWKALGPVPWTQSVRTRVLGPGAPGTIIWRHSWRAWDAPGAKTVSLYCEEMVANDAGSELRARLDESRSVAACCVRAAQGLRSG